MPTLLEDELALRKTAELYAAGADRRDKELWTSILTEDCELQGPNFHVKGRDRCLRSIDLLTRSFVKTQHRVHNQLVTVKDNVAEGETYSVADHLSESEGRQSLLTWAIRYQDRWRREEGVWRFTHRLLVIDWEEARIVRPNVAH